MEALSRRHRAPRTTATPSGGSSTPSRTTRSPTASAPAGGDLARATPGAGSRRSAPRSARRSCSPRRASRCSSRGRRSSRTRWFHDQDPIDWTQANTPTPASCSLYRDLIRLRRNWCDTTARAARPPRQRAPRQRRGQRDRLPPLAPRRARRRRGRRRQRRRTVATTPTASAAPGGAWRVRFNSDWAGYSALSTTTPVSTPWRTMSRETAWPTAATSASAATRRSSSLKTPSETGQQPQR